MTRKIAGAIFAALLILAGCKQDTDHTTLAPYLYDYVPTNVGHSVIYDVDSISYNYVSGNVQIMDTVHYQLMELIMDSNNSVCTYQPGVICYGVAEYKRYDTTQPFPPTYQAWYFSTNKSVYVTDQNDLPIEKFTFPPVNGNTWLGNSMLPANDTIADTYQVYGGWVYTFTSVNVPNTINGHYFDSTSVVTDVNNQNAINSVVSIETYARHIGLVSRQWEVIDKQDPLSPWTNPNQAVGFRIFMWYHSSTH